MPSSAAMPAAHPVSWPVLIVQPRRSRTPSSRCTSAPRRSTVRFRAPSSTSEVTAQSTSRTSRRSAPERSSSPMVQPDNVTSTRVAPRRFTKSALTSCRVTRVSSAPWAVSAPNRPPTATTSSSVASTRDHSGARRSASRQLASRARSKRTPATSQSASSHSRNRVPVASPVSCSPVKRSPSAVPAPVSSGPGASSSSGSSVLRSSASMGTTPSSGGGPGRVERRGPGAGGGPGEVGDLVGGHVARAVATAPGTHAGQQGRQPGPALDDGLPHLPAHHGTALEHRVLLDQPARPDGEGLRAGRVAQGGIPGQPQRDSQDGEDGAGDQHLPPAEGRGQDGSRDEHEDPRDGGPDHAAPAGGRRVRPKRSGVGDQQAGQRRRLRLRTERQQLPPAGGVAQAGDQRAGPGRPDQPHAQPLADRPATDP